MPAKRKVELVSLTYFCPLLKENRTVKSDELDFIIVKDQFNHSRDMVAVVDCKCGHEHDIVLREEIIK